LVSIQLILSSIGLTGSGDGDGEGEGEGDGEAGADGSAQPVKANNNAKIATKKTKRNFFIINLPFSGNRK
jgi:hypothetical protein